MRPNPSLPHSRVFIALALTALLLTSASAETSRPGVAQRPATNLKLDQVDSKTSNMRTPATAKIESLNARAKGSDPFKGEVIGIEPDMAKAPRAKTAKAASGDEAGTLKGMRSKATPSSPNAASGGSPPTRKATAQYNPKELGVDKRK